MPEQTRDDVLVFNRIFIMYDRNSNMSDNDFDELFREFGSIRQIHISKEQSTGNAKGVCYITFEKTSEACIAAEEMNNKSLDGHQKKIKVHIAHDRRGSLEIDVEPEKMLQRLFVNHPKNASAEEVKSYFQEFGEVIWMYQLKDKNTGIPKGSAFIKYEHQSQAAIALESCNAATEHTYRARWADVRKADPNAPPQRHGLSLEMSGERGGSHRHMDSMAGSSRGSRGMGGGGGMGGSGGGMGGPAEGIDVDPMSFVNNRMGRSMGPKVIEALVPKALTQQHIFRLFDVAPGLQNINQDTISGMVTCHYASPACAAYAKEKMDGMELYGQVIAVRFAKSQVSGGFPDPAAQLQETLRNLQTSGAGGAGNVQALVNSLQQVTKAIASGAGGSMRGDGGGDMFDYEPVSSVRLPPVKPLMSPDTPAASKVFINSMPPTPKDLLPNDVLVNICSRFGNLISVRWVLGKRFGFASYAQSSSALAAVNKLNGAVIDDNSLKVELAKTSSAEGEGPNPQKRARQF